MPRLWMCLQKIEGFEHTNKEPFRMARAEELPPSVCDLLDVFERGRRYRERYFAGGFFLVIVSRPASLFLASSPGTRSPRLA